MSEKKEENSEPIKEIDLVNNTDKNYMQQEYNPSNNVKVSPLVNYSQKSTVKEEGDGNVNKPVRVNENIFIFNINKDSKTNQEESTEPVEYKPDDTPLKREYGGIIRNEQIDNDYSQYKTNSSVMKLEVVGRPVGKEVENIENDVDVKQPVERRIIYDTSTTQKIDMPNIENKAKPISISPKYDITGNQSFTINPTHQQIPFSQSIIVPQTERHYYSQSLFDRQFSRSATDDFRVSDTSAKSKPYIKIEDNNADEIKFKETPKRSQTYVPSPKSDIAEVYSQYPSQSYEEKIVTVVRPIRPVPLNSFDLNKLNPDIQVSPSHIQNIGKNPSYRYGVEGCKVCGGYGFIKNKKNIDKMDSCLVCVRETGYCHRCKNTGYINNDLYNKCTCRKVR